MPMLFKRFKAPVSEDEFNEFIGTHIIIRDQYFENGDISVFYKEVTDLGQSPIDQIETLDRAITKAQQDIDAHTEDQVDVHAALAEVMEKIAASTPNNKKEWDGLQKRREELENMDKTNIMSIEGRQKTLAQYAERHANLLTALSKTGKKKK